MKKYFAKLSPLERRFLVIVMTVVFIVLNYVFVRPHLHDWARVNARLQTAHDLQQKFDTAIKQRPTYEAGIKVLEKDGASVPSEDQDIEFLRNVQTQAALSGVQLLGSSKQQGVRTNQFFVERVQLLTVQSTEKQLIDFLYNLGSGSSMIRVRDFSIRPTLDRQRLASTIKLVASYQKKTATTKRP